MSFKSVRFLIFSSVSLLFVACGTDSDKKISSEVSELLEASITEGEAESALEFNYSVELEEKEDEVKAELAPDNIVRTPARKKESMYSVQDRALNQLTAVSHLEKEGYSYHFAEIDSPEFIQIEVREIPEKSFEHTSLEGVYRYLLGTEEILMKDYFSGDFTPYEQNK